MSMVNRIIDAVNHFPDTKLLCGEFITDAGLCPLSMVALHEDRIDRRGLFLLRKSQYPNVDIANLLGISIDWVDSFVTTWDGLERAHINNTEEGCGTCDALYLLRYFEKKVL